MLQNMPEAVESHERWTKGLGRAIKEQSQLALRDFLRPHDAGGGAGGGPELRGPQPSPIPPELRERIAAFLRGNRILSRTSNYNGGGFGEPQPIEGPETAVHPSYLNDAKNPRNDCVAQHYRIDPATGKISLAVGLGWNLFLFYPPTLEGQRVSVVPPVESLDAPVVAHTFTFEPHPTPQLASTSVLVRVPKPLSKTGNLDGVYVSGAGRVRGQITLYMLTWSLANGFDWKTADTRVFFEHPTPFMEVPPDIVLRSDDVLREGASQLALAVRAEVLAAVTEVSDSWLGDPDGACLDLMDPTEKLRMTPPNEMLSLAGLGPYQGFNRVENSGPIEVQEMQVVLTDLP